MFDIMIFIERWQSDGPRFDSEAINTLESREQNDLLYQNSSASLNRKFNSLNKSTSKKLLKTHSSPWELKRVASMRE